MFLKTLVWSAVKSGIAFWGALFALRTWAPELASLAPGTTSANVLEFAATSATYLLSVALYDPVGVLLVHLVLAFIIGILLGGRILRGRLAGHEFVVEVTGYWWYYTVVASILLWLFATYLT